MIFDVLKNTADKFPNKVFLKEVKREVTYVQIRDMAISVAKDLPSSGRVYFYHRDGVELFAFLFAANLRGLEICLLNRQEGVSEAQNKINSLGGGGYVVTDFLGEGLNCMCRPKCESIGGGVLHRGGDSGLIIYTTGTTGAPKAVSYSWNRLLSQVRLSESEKHANWLLAYPLNHFAGVQMFVHALCNGAALTIPQGRGVSDVLSAFRGCAVSAISATPTFWRMFLGRLSDADKVDLRDTLKRITLGGEAATEDILARLRTIFPLASITHVYATTELGSCFSVKDGYPGFPTEYLNRKVGHVELKIVNSELFVKTEKSMNGYLGERERPDVLAGGWVGTGDLVEISGERVFFLGRKSEAFNVGGIKVFPPKVEAVILGVAGVETVRVYARKNPITGLVVAAEVQVLPGFDHGSVLRSIKQQCRAQLGRYEQPISISLVPSIERANEKIVRRNL